MNDVNLLMRTLETNPVILQNLLSGIKTDQLKIHRKKGKWSIHEHACHLAHADKMILDRFKLFATTQSPVFSSYLPGKTVSIDLLAMDLNEAMTSFENTRAEMIQLLKEFDSADWENEATHEEYSQYNPYILLRHTVMHDYFHMYRVEELWLTRDNFL